MRPFLSLKNSFFNNLCPSTDELGCTSKIYGIAWEFTFQMSPNHAAYWNMNLHLLTLWRKQKHCRVCITAFINKFGKNNLFSFSTRSLI